MIPVFFDESAFIESPDPLRQSDIAPLRAQHRLQGAPLLRWCERQTQGGGFGDIAARPRAWGVWLMADGQWRRVVSARGKPREWSSLDRAERWLYALGFTAFMAVRGEGEGDAGPG